MELKLILKRLLQVPSNGLIGLDIGSNSLKLVKINSLEYPYFVENVAIEPIPDKAFRNDEIVNHGLIADLLKTMIKNEKIESKNVALSIPYSATIIKNILVDKRMTEEDIEQRTWIEANHLFPDLVGNIYLDFTILGPYAEDNSQLEVMLVVCRKDIIKPYLEILKLASLTPKVIDVSTHALERALSVLQTPTEINKITALLNLDMRISTFIVVQNNRILYAYDQSFDGQRLMTQVAKYKIDNQKVEIDNDEKYLAIIHENLSAHIRHVIHFFYSRRPNMIIEKMLIAGDCADLPNISNLVQQEVSVDTEKVNPFLQMHFMSDLDKQRIEKNAASFMLCSGLALSTY